MLQVIKYNKELMGCKEIVLGSVPLHDCMLF